MINRLLLLLVLLVSCALPPALAQQHSLPMDGLTPTKTTIVISRVSTNPKKHYKHLKPVADYLASHLAEFGITEGKVVFAKSNAQMVDYIRTGKVDLVTETLFSAIEFQQQAQAEIALRRWKKGVAEYSTIIFTKQGLGIESLDDLVGKTIAFQDPGSSSGYFIPASVLIQKGYKVQRLETPRHNPPVDAIGYVFANKEINISAWVNKGIVEAGALSDREWDNIEDMPASFQVENQVLYQSPPFPRAVELIRSDLPEELKHRVIDILVNAHNDPRGRQALQAYQKTKKFDHLTEQEESIRIAAELRKVVVRELME
ncbi:phosphate/phosphite/phosphonate ABC transporter substrate-binding protein [Vibrio sp. WXL210]|uniref:phosphate/phosphite/phosphonate ABC transporter substrate-binding protein n=1 Tax=Vibrio sp. WXL210 TaxID=3450709 RepID=UPI003EC4FA1E